MTVHIDRSLRLPDTEYFADLQRKTGIAIHHTVCDSARDTLHLWRRDQENGGGVRHVATAFVIDPDGTIYEAFDADAWAYQFGLSWGAEARMAFEKRFIGIELTSEGGLIEEHGELYAYEHVSSYTIKPRAQAFDAVAPYRGFRWFARYEDDQLESLGRLVGELCNRFPIPRVYPEKPFLYYGNGLASFEGVIGHAMVRADKSDPAPDPRLWRALEQIAGLKPVRVVPSAGATATARPLSAGELSDLYSRNARRLNELETGAGSLVKNLLMELARRQVFLKLDTPAPGDHAIPYHVAQGDSGEVARVARALGFKSVTSEVLEVQSA